MCDMGKLTVERSSCAGNLSYAVRRIQTLPDGPHAVDLRVVEIEDRIAGADVGIVSGIATDGEVPAGMDAGDRLEGIVERSDVFGAGDQGRDVRRLGLVAPDE